MKNNSFLAVLLVAAMWLTSCGSQRGAVPLPPAEECAVLGFQYSTNVTSEEAKDIADVFRVNFHPSKYKVTEAERVDNVLGSRRYKSIKLTKHQQCELGRSLGAKYVVFGSINKLMDEYSIDVQVIDTQKETITVFEGDAFPKADYIKRIPSIARKLASKIK